MIPYSTFIIIVIVVLFVKGGISLIGSVLAAFMERPDPANVVGMGIVAILDILLGVLFITLG